MALPATDNFTTGSDQALATYSASWTQNNGAANVLDATDDVVSFDNSDWLAHWNADSFDDDQYAQLVLSAVGEDTWIGPSARVAASATTGYLIDCRSKVGATSKYLSKLVAGSWTTLASSTNSYSVSDLIRLEAEGSTITPLVNGSEDTDLGAQTDSAITSGSAGLAGYGKFAPVSRGDDWEGGNLAAGGGDSNAALSGQIKRRRFHPLLVR
jgi:hypothetical protein